MSYESELREAGRWTSGDILAGADWILAELRDSFPCQTCGSLEPAIIEGAYCCDCTDEAHEAFLETRVKRLAREAGVA